MCSESESVRFHLRMTETLDSLIESLNKTIVTSTNRGKAYFRPAIQKLLHVSPSIIEQHEKGIRDRKIVLRQFSLIQRSLRSMNPKDMTVLKSHEVRQKVSEAWTMLEEIEKQDEKMQESLAFIDKHVSGVKNFLQHMEDELNEEDGIYEITLDESDILNEDTDEDISF